MGQSIRHLPSSMQLPTTPLFLLQLLFIGLNARPTLHPEIEDDLNDLPPVMSGVPEHARYDFGDDYDEDAESDSKNNNTTIENFNYDYEYGMNDTLDVNDDPIETNETLIQTLKESLDISVLDIEKNDAKSKETEDTIEKTNKKQAQSNIRPMYSNIEILPYLSPTSGKYAQELGMSEPGSFANQNTKFLPTSTKYVGHNQHQYPGYGLNTNYGSSYSYGQLNSLGNGNGQYQGQLMNNGHRYGNTNGHGQEHVQYNGQIYGLNSNAHGQGILNGLKYGHGAQTINGHYGNIRQQKPNRCPRCGKMKAAPMFGQGRKDQLSWSEHSRAANYNNYYLQQAKDTPTLEHSHNTYSGYKGWGNAA